MPYESAGTRCLRRSLLPLDQALHKPALQDQDDEHRWEECQDGRGHNNIPLGELGARTGTRWAIPMTTTCISTVVVTIKGQRY